MSNRHAHQLAQYLCLKKKVKKKLAIRSVFVSCTTENTRNPVACFQACLGFFELRPLGGPPFTSLFCHAACTRHSWPQRPVGQPSSRNEQASGLAGARAAGDSSLDTTTMQRAQTRRSTTGFVALCYGIRPCNQNENLGEL